MDLGISGKVAIVTGGSRGIGRATAAMLAREGANVALVGRDTDVGTSAARTIAEETGARVQFHVADTGDDAAVDGAVKRIAEDFGAIDILVNAASPSGGGFVPLAEIDTGAAMSVIDVKVMGYLRMARAAAPHMAKAGWGRIVNIGGIAAYHTGSTEGSIRSVAIGALTKNLAIELGGEGITVNAIHPAATRTERLKDVVEEMAASRNVSAEEIEGQFAASGVLGRFLDPAEVASVIAFLVAAPASAINGESIEVSGGTKGSIRY